MPRVVSHTEVASVADGGTLTVDADTIVTPLAAEEARARGVTIARQNGAGVAPTLVRQVARQVVARMGDAQPEVLEAVVAEVMTRHRQRRGVGVARRGRPRHRLLPGVPRSGARAHAQPRRPDDDRAQHTRASSRG